MRIHQLVPAISAGDAISNHTFEIDARLRAWGYDSAIYADGVEPALRDRVRSVQVLRPFLSEPDDLLIYHYGMFHYSMHLFQSAKCKQVLIYHNITPARFFRGWESAHEQSCALGRIVLRRMTGCDLAAGVSEFNRQELVAAGFDEEKTAVLPIFLTPGQIDKLPVDTQLQQQIKQPGITNWLTVGRNVPNKAIDDLLRMFYVYQKQVNPNAHLYLVGSRGLPSYNQALDQLVDALALNEHVTFTGRVSDSQLKTYYQSADLFVSASYHEGFCVPLLESMYFDLPILARKAAAIPETLGDAGVLFTGSHYGEIAEMAHLMVTDQTLRQQIIQTQRSRLETFSIQKVEENLKTILKKVDVV